MDERVGVAAEMVAMVLPSCQLIFHNSMIHIALRMMINGQVECVILKAPIIIRMDIVISTRGRIGGAMPGVALACRHRFRLMLRWIHLYQDTVCKLAVRGVSRQQNILRTINNDCKGALGGAVLPKILVCAKGRHDYRIVLANRIRRQAHNHVGLLMHHDK